MVIIGGLIAVFATAILCRCDRPALGQRQARRRRLLHDRRRAHGRRARYAITSDVDVHRGLISFDRHGRLQPASACGCARTRSTPIFVGVAARDDVDDYLDDTATRTLTDFDFAPFRPQYRTASGDEPPAAPTEQRSGRRPRGHGTQTLDWDVESGGWTLVADERRRLTRASTRPSTPARRSPIIGQVGVDRDRRRARDPGARRRC